MCFVIKKIFNVKLIYSGILLKQKILHFVLATTVAGCVRKPGTEAVIGLFDCPITHWLIQQNNILLSDTSRWMILLSD